MPSNEDLRELLRLTRENNRMLHRARRRAVWGGVVKFTLYALILVAAPLWLYSTYLAPMMQQVLSAYQDIQGTGVKAQAQFDDIQNYLKQFTSQFSSQE